MTPRQQAALQRKNDRLEDAYIRGLKPITRAEEKLRAVFDKKYAAVQKAAEKKLRALDRALAKKRTPLEMRKVKLHKRTIGKMR